MKTLRAFAIAGIFLLLGVITLVGSEINSSQQAIEVSAELKEKHSLKGYHDRLSFRCEFCHEGQGDDPSKFKAIGDEGCISCHGTKKDLAERLTFMDKLHVNPHNSIHDGPTLYCDECHYEHKPSTNMCTECHEPDMELWMRPTP